MISAMRTEELTRKARVRGLHVRQRYVSRGLPGAEFCKTGEETDFAVKMGVVELPIGASGCECLLGGVLGIRLGFPQVMDLIHCRKP